MTFWEFADHHWGVALALAFIALLAIDSLGTDIVRSILAARGVPGGLLPKKITAKSDSDKDKDAA